MTADFTLDAATLAMVSGRTLRDIVDMPSAIDAVRRAFVDSYRGSIEQPLRMALAGGRSLVMAAADDSGDFAVKAVTVFPQNSGSLPVVQGVMFLFDGVTGSPQVGIDGPTLTALRTGAASGVATSLLAEPDAAVLAVIGAGGQAWDQIVAVCAVRPITEVRLSSRTRQSAETLGSRIRNRFPALQVSVWTTPAEAVSEADIVCTATTASRPLFVREDLRDHVHINAIGAHTAGAAEVPPDVIDAASVVTVDSLASARAEAGDLICAARSGRWSWDGVRELGALILEPPARAGITVFKSVGIAAQDLAVAKLAHQRLSAAAT